MEPFTVLSSHLVTLPFPNVDTDQIIPARFLKVISRRGLAKYLFYDWRYDAEGKPRPDNILNRPESETAKIILAGDNFGCGSSREHAAWALYDFGFRAVISTSFGDIFRGNALKNALLPVLVSTSEHSQLLMESSLNPRAAFTIDLVRQVIASPAGNVIPFALDGFSRECLLNGMDELDYILKQHQHISAWENRRVFNINTLAPS